jgi:HSP20 family protein
MSPLTKSSARLPARELSTVRNRLRHFFEEPFGLTMDFPFNIERRMSELLWSPAVEATENEKEYLITAELPGISQENIAVSVVDGVLTLRGTKDEERKSEDKEKTFHLWEREYGKFERTFRFPMAVLDDKVSAEFLNGVLTVRIPKAEVQRPTARTVPIAKKV